MMPSSKFIETLSGKKALRLKGLNPKLDKLDCELTERCNNNCVHCTINLSRKDKEAEKREASTADFKRILREAAALGLKLVQFTGGEPLVRDDFEELYGFARGLGLRVLLFTNATLITPSLAGLFARIPPAAKIEVTVYGMKKTSYEAVSRVAGSFEAAWRGMQLLLERKIPFIVKGALLPANKHETAEFERWAASLPAMDKPVVYSMFFDLRCRKNGSNTLIRKLRISPEEGLKVFTRMRDKYIKSMKNLCARSLPPMGDELFTCDAGYGSGCVDAYGMLQPCMQLRHPDLVYDLKNGSLADALSRVFPKLKTMRAVNPEYLARCARCFLRGLCDQCPAKSWNEHRTLDTPVEYLCDIAHAQARFLGLLEKHESAWSVRDGLARIKKFTRQEEASS